MKSREKPPFQNITIIGVGLIGGSLAMAIRQRFPSVIITGIDKPQVLKRALSCKAINVAGKSVQQAVRSADLVILAAPVTDNLKILPLVAKNCRAETIVTDTSSIKQILVKKAASLFPGGNFIGGHPMAGSEFSGIEAANPLLFQNALYILTPAPSTKKLSLQRLTKFIASLDARIFITDPATHDSVAAAVSHLPQLAAVALMNSVGKYHPNAPSHLAFAAGGFRDMTRIASSPFSIWKDILSSNQKEIHKALDIYIKQLKKIASMVNSSPARLSGEFKSSCSLRSRIPRSMKGYVTPLVELIVFLEDKPGELARLASSLAKRAINIKDMELLKVREGRGGTFRLSFENRAIASEAAQTLRKAGFEVSGKW